MLENTHDSFKEVNNGKPEYTTAGLDSLDDFFDFDAATLNTWTDPGVMNPSLVTQQFQQDPTDVVFPLDFLPKGCDSSESQPPHLPSSKRSFTGPTPQDDLLKSTCTGAEEHTADTNNKAQTGFTVFAIWNPNTELNANSANRKAAKMGKLSSKNRRRKSRASGDKRRKRAPNGSICVRCRLQKGKVCWSKSNDSILLIRLVVCWRVSLRRVREQNLVEEYMLPCKARSSLLL
jgi:hypothetical protein